MTDSADAVFDAIFDRSDDRGFCRVALDALVSDTALSRATVKRAIRTLVAEKRIIHRSKTGPSGGLQFRILLGSELGSLGSELGSLGSSDAKSFEFGSGSAKPNQEPEPNSRLSNSAHSAHSAHSAPSARTNSGPAWRECKDHEIPESGATLLYTQSSADGWRYLSPTAWLAPNGDYVSVKSMTPELRMRLGVDPE